MLVERIYAAFLNGSIFQKGFIIWMSLGRKFSNVVNVSHSDDRPACELRDCVYGFSTASKVVFIFLSLLCGIFAIGGNFAFLVALNRALAFRHRVNYDYTVSLAIADFVIGTTMTPLYICYAVEYYLPGLSSSKDFFGF